MPKALSTLVVGNKVEIPVNAAYQSRFGSKIVFKVADKNHSGYPANSVTLITDKIIQLMCSDAKEASNPNTDRQSYGNNRHIHSNLLQWLNSNAAAGAWYSAKHAYDAPPNNANVNSGWNDYDTWAGFLAMLPAQFVAALMDTTLTVVKNTVTDGGSYETFTAKMFLPSTTEVGLANENGIAEGVKLALFSDNTSRLAYPTAQAVSNSEYTNASLNTSSAWYWWLRTPYVSYADYVRYVYSGGTLNYISAYDGYVGVRPLCNLSSDILVSDNVNADGNYEIIWNTAPSAPAGITVPATIYDRQNINISWGASTDPDNDAITYTLERSVNSGSYTQVTTTAGLTFSEAVQTSWNTIRYRVKATDTYNNSSAYITSDMVAVIHNQPPVISGNNGDLGVKAADFNYQYSVTDPDNDIVTVVEKLNGTTIKTHTVTLGQQYSMSVSGNNFLALPNGQHTLTVTATDSANNSSTRTMTFTKQVSGLTIQFSEPLEATTQPKRVNISVTREIPAGATFKVEATNNPFDPSPAWEDCTNAVLQGVAHVFENTVNAAVQYGLNIRVTVNRGAAIGTCWVSGIGGNFE
ncbi:DUF6273 domain-containing protein [Caproiciproducens galactitolivorans]|uniref:DUF6273 domain-containing protein n=1 Tax=Caproiciproducens galactitolivorans TaxID=642589 RepID=UPI002408FE5F|nr:DUF6273 domain-containing protein [Caproiciproducens galactitolivorans]